LKDYSLPMSTYFHPIVAPVCFKVCVSNAVEYPSKHNNQLGNCIGSRSALNCATKGIDTVGLGIVSLVSRRVVIGLISSCSTTCGREGDDSLSSTVKSVDSIRDPPAKGRRLRRMTQKAAIISSINRRKTTPPSAARPPMSAMLVLPPEAGEPLEVAGSVFVGEVLDPGDVLEPPTVADVSEPGRNAPVRLLSACSINVEVTQLGRPDSSNRYFS
jgi:hypothetical protein